MEKLYLVCEGCGEAFDSLEYAFAHNKQCDDSTFPVFTVVPESVAL